MKDLKAEGDASQLSSLAGADASEGQDHAAAALRRSRRLRVLAIVVVVVGALAVIVFPHLRDDTRLSRVTNLAAQSARGDLPAASCPPTPEARDAVKPSSAVVLGSAVVCHYLGARRGTRPVEGPVPTLQLAGISADMNAHTVSAPLTQPPGLPSGAAAPDSWVVVGVTTDGERLQLFASPYPSVYTWDGLGPGLEWHPSDAVQKLLATDLPR
jgi:hypothetical protein